MDTLPLVGGIGIVILGGVWYLIYGRDRVERTGLVGEALIDTVEPENSDADRPYRIVVPIANPESQKGLLELAAASAAAHDDAEVVIMNVVTVPDQTALAQEVAYEQERIERQYALLEEAEDIVADLDVGLRTRSIVGRDVADAILMVIDQEEADDVFMGWSGTRKRHERVLGSNIDRIVEHAPCEVTLVRPESGTVGDVVVFVGSGPYSATAVKRASEFVAADPDAELTLVNVQSTSDDENEEAIRERGQTLIDEVATRAGVTNYTAEVVVNDDIERTIIEHAKRHDTACLGVSRISSVERMISSSIPDQLGHEVDGPLVLVRSDEPTNRSLRTALARRLTSALA